MIPAIDLLGFVAATFTTSAFLPQALKVWRSRSTDDISLGMYLILTTGIALWLTYGVLLDAWPIIIANGLTLLLAGSILLMKWHFSRRR